MAIARRFKSYFFRGLAVLIPTILTIWIFVWGYKFIQENISIHINRGLVRLTMYLKSTHGQEALEHWTGFWVNEYQINVL